MSEIRDVIIIGGGAAGLCSAVLLAKAGKKVTLLEKTRQIGKKLSVTGNGRCNFTNLYQTEDCYQGGDTKKAFEIVKQFDQNQILHFFEKLGILPNIKKGRSFDNPLASYVYPMSESGKDFVQVLSDKVFELKVKVKTDCHVRGIYPEDDGSFRIETGESDLYSYRGKQLIIATGGLAMPSSGSDGSIFSLLTALGHSVIKPLPALTSLKTESKEIQDLSGIRMEAEIRAILGEEEEAALRQVGELQFSSKGISGIPAMQISGRIARALDQGKAVNCHIDFMTNYSFEELFRILKRRREDLAKKDISKFFMGMFPDKFSLILRKKIPQELRFIGEIRDETLVKLTEILKNYRVRIHEVGDFSVSQTTSGGIPLSETDDALGSIFVKNMYFAGEVLDVDGLCGGYNLTWAWASASLVSKKIGES